MQDHHAQFTPGRPHNSHLPSMPTAQGDQWKHHSKQWHPNGKSQSIINSPSTQNKINLRCQCKNWSWKNHETQQPEWLFAGGGGAGGVGGSGHLKAQKGGTDLPQSPRPLSRQAYLRPQDTRLEAAHRKGRGAVEGAGGSNSWQFDSRQGDNYAILPKGKTANKLTCHGREQQP